MHRHVSMTTRLLQIIRESASLVQTHAKRRSAGRIVQLGSPTPQVCYQGAAQPLPVSPELAVLPPLGPLIGRGRSAPSRPDLRRGFVARRRMPPPTGTRGPTRRAAWLRDRIGQWPFRPRGSFSPTRQSRFAGWFAVSRVDGPRCQRRPNRSGWRNTG